MSLAAVLDQRAVERVGVGDRLLPAHFGDARREYDAARDGIALTHRAGRGLVRFAGADRGTFLQGLLSNDVAGLAAGEGTRALFLDTKGHVRGILDLWAGDDALVVGCEGRFIDTVVPDLTRYVLGADVQVQDLRPTDTVLALLGAGADAALAAAGFEIPPVDAGAHRAAEIAGTPVRLARTLDLGVPGVEVHAPGAAALAVWEALEALSGEPPVCAGWQACEALRIEAGVARMGHEISGAEFPQELCLDDAVDYEKGCYLGQETVARIHYRGQVNRLLSGLRAASPLPAGAVLVAAEREVGQITSSAHSPRLGEVALALIRRDEAESNATVQVRVGGDTVAEARVVTPPQPA